MFDRENNQWEILYSQYMDFQSFFREFQSKIYQENLVANLPNFNLVN